jgi:hypothetical protein
VRTTVGVVEAAPLGVDAPAARSDGGRRPALRVHGVALVRTPTTSSPPPVTATLALVLAVAVPACASFEQDDPALTAEASEPPAMAVNGVALSLAERSWVGYVARSVVPRLGGERATRLTIAARVTWWSLKEGVLDLPNAVLYSNCNTSGGDVRIGALDVCGPGRAWQVGLSGVQVAGQDLATLEGLATALYGAAVEDVLRDAAVEGGVPDLADAIADSTGSLRGSWLLRDSAIGFTQQEPIVTSECIAGSYGWCYGGGWDTSAAFAPSRDAAMGAIDELYAQLDGLAP